MVSIMSSAIRYCGRANLTTDKVSTIYMYTKKDCP